MSLTDQAIATTAHLSDIVEVPVRHRLLSRQLPELVEEQVQLELGRQVGQASVAERLEGPVGDEGAHQVHVRDVHVEIGVLVLDGSPVGEVGLGLEDVVDSVDGLELESAVLGELAVPGVVVTLGRVDGMICRS